MFRVFSVTAMFPVTAVFHHTIVFPASDCSIFSNCLCPVTAVFPSSNHNVSCDRSVCGAIYCNVSSGIINTVDLGNICQ